MTAQDAEYAFDAASFDEDGKRKPRRRKKDKGSREARRHRDGKHHGDRPPREDALRLAREGGGLSRGKDSRRRNRSVRDLEKMKAPSNAIRYPDCPVSGKRSYGSPAAAADAMETIRQVKTGTHYPTRAYRCEHCDYWHMTSKDFQSGLPNPDAVSPGDRKPAGMHDPSELVRQAS